MRSALTRTFTGISFVLAVCLAACSTPAVPTETVMAEAPVESPVIQASHTPEPSATPIPATATIAHILSPGEPGGGLLNLTDVNASSSAAVSNGR